MNVPAKLEKTTEELQKNSAKKDELLGMKSLNEKIVRLKEKDIPQLETRLTDTDAVRYSLTLSRYAILEYCIPFYYRRIFYGLIYSRKDLTIIDAITNPQNLKTILFYLLI